jgi:hypothetical protein
VRAGAQNPHPVGFADHLLPEGEGITLTDARDVEIVDYH